MTATPSTTIELVPLKLRLNDPGAFRKIVMGLHSLNAEPGELHRRIVEGVCTLLQCHDAALILLDPVTGRFRPAHILADELAEEISPDLDLRDGVVGRVVANGVPVADTAITPDGDYYPVFQGAGSEATVAIQFGRRSVGALVVASSRLNAFTERHLEALGMFADQAAIALEHADRSAATKAEAGAWEELFRHFKDGMVVCDAALKVRRVNGGFLKMVNRSVAQLQNCSAQDVFYRLSIFGSQEDFWDLLLRHGRHEVKFRTPSGRRSFHLTGSRVTMQGESAYLMVLRETTQQDELQDRINRADKLATVTSVVSKIAHQLNNRLQSVVGLAEICEQKQSSGSITSEVRHIEEQSRRSAALVKSMLLHTCQVQPEFQELKANDFIRTNVEAWRSQRLEADVQLRLEIPDRPIHILADRLQLREVLTHLLNHTQHALLAEPPAHDPRITVRLSETDDQVTLVIGHNGFGLTTRVLDRVFEPNFNLENSSDQTGLELHLCQHTVKANGGTIACETSGREGLEFVIRLPAHRSQSAAAEMIEGPAVSSLSGLRVLVVDDDPVISGLMREILQADGVQVEAVTDAREGLRLSTEQEFDLVLSDLKMPGMSGCEFHRELHKVRPELASRIIFATGDLPAQAVSEFCNGPTPQFLMKPFSFSQLRLAISTRLGELRPAA